MGTSPPPREYQQVWSQAAEAVSGWPSVSTRARSGYADPHECINLHPTHLGTPHYRQRTVSPMDACVRTSR